MFLRLSHVEREQWFLKYVISATTRLLTLATVPAAADPDKIIFRFPKFLSEFLAFPWFVKSIFDDMNSNLALSTVYKIFTNIVLIKKK